MKIPGIVSAVMILSGIAIAPASATAVGCTTYNDKNGTKSFNTAPDVGTVGSGDGQVCQIGILNPQSGDAASFTDSDYPSIYAFDYGGGELTISESAYYDGGQDATQILVEIFSLATGKAVQLGQYTYSALQGYNASKPLFDLNLTSGLYAIETTIPDSQLSAQLGNNAQNQNVADNDPKYQVNFVSTPSVVAAVPEPWTLALFGAGLAGATILRRRKTANAA